MKQSQVLRFDWAMKRLLRQKANFEILEGFLSELLKDQISITQILDSESNQESENDKQNRVDILVENRKKEIIIIEIQNHTDMYYFQRILYGVSKVITEYIAKGVGYMDIRKVYSVNLVFFDLGYGTDYIYRGKTIFEGENDGSLLHLSTAQQALIGKKMPGDILPEYIVIKINQFNNVAKNTLDEWIYYFKNSEIKEEFTAQGLQEAMENLNESLLPPDERASYGSYIDNQYKDASERETARIEGRNEGITKMVLAGAQNNLSIELLSSMSGLSAKEVQDIINKDTERAKNE